MDNMSQRNKRYSKSRKKRENVVCFSKGPLWLLKWKQNSS